MLVCDGPGCKNEIHMYCLRPTINKVSLFHFLLHLLFAYWPTALYPPGSYPRATGIVMLALSKGQAPN